jgi:hypothetical protein
MLVTRPSAVGRSILLTFWVAITVALTSCTSPTGQPLHLDARVRSPVEAALSTGSTLFV